MATRIYILRLEGEPMYATTNLNKLMLECHEWMDDHSDNYSIRREYENWLDDRGEYPNTEEGEEAAWDDYIRYVFEEEGEWGDYSYCEVWLD